MQQRRRLCGRSSSVIGVALLSLLLWDTVRWVAASVEGQTPDPLLDEDGEVSVNSGRFLTSRAGRRLLEDEEDSDEDGSGAEEAEGGKAEPKTQGSSEWDGHPGLGLEAKRRRPNVRLHAEALRVPGGCWSCAEKRLFYPEGILSSGSLSLPSLADRLESYRVMHERCTGAVTDWDAFYLSEGDGVREGHHTDGCKYLLFDAPAAYTGLADRILGAVSAFVYALLTQRAFVLSSEGLLPHLFSDPMQPSSQWTIPAEGFKKIRHDVKKRPEKTASGVYKRHSIQLLKDPSQQDWQFLCPEEQEAAASARFAVFSSAMFFVPALYATPSFKAELDLLFPTRRVFLRVAQLLLNPSNHIWDRITRIYEGQLAHADLVIGLELAKFNDNEDANAASFNASLSCAQGLAQCLPGVLPPEEWSTVSKHAEEVILRRPRGPLVSVFVSTANVSYPERLRSLYTNGKPRDGSTVSVHTEADLADWEQSGRDKAERELTDLWLLSFSDVLLVPAGSALGQVCASLGGLRPYVVRPPKSSASGAANATAGQAESDCWLGPSEPCLQVLPPQGAVQCQHNVTLRIKAGPDSALQQCPGGEPGVAALLVSDVGSEA